MKKNSTKQICKQIMDNMMIPASKRKGNLLASVMKKAESLSPPVTPKKTTRKKKK